MSDTPSTPPIVATAREVVISLTPSGQNPGGTSVTLTSPGFYFLEENLSFSTGFDYATISSLNTKVYDIAKGVMGGFDIGSLFGSGTGVNGFKTVLSLIDFVYESNGVVPAIKIIQEYKIATKAQPIKFTANFKFSFGKQGLYDGYLEVYQPIMRVVDGLSATPDSNTGSPLKTIFLPGQTYSDLMLSNISGLFSGITSITGIFQGNQITYGNSNSNSSPPSSNPPTNPLSALVGNPSSNKNGYVTNVIHNLNQSVLGSNPPTTTTGSHDMKISVKIGRLLTMGDCIVDSMSWVFDDKIDSNGFPVSGNLSISFESRNPFSSKNGIGDGTNIWADPTLTSAPTTSSPSSSPT